MSKKGVFIPVIHVAGESIPETWEKAYLAVNEKGIYHTRQDPDEKGQPNLDTTMIMEVRNPDADPFTHRAGGSTATDDALLDYLMEMMGAKPAHLWIRDFDDPKDMKWEYNYHASLTEWGAHLPKGMSNCSINQLDDNIVKKLIEDFSTRKAQAITWDPRRDTVAEHTPCLQRIHPMMVTDDDGNPSFDMQYFFRSRNVADASFGNMLALYVTGCDMRDKIEKGLGIERMPMRMVDHVDSFHVNGNSVPKYLQNLESFNKRVANGDWATLEDRTLTREETIEGLKYYREKVEGDIIKQTAKYFKGSDTELDVERQRVHDIGDRIFYLLDKYAPQ